MRTLPIFFALALASPSVASVVCDLDVLEADDGAAGDEFATALALDGALAVVGAPEEDQAGSSAGAAYAFRLVGDAWVQEQKLAAPGGTAFDDFGFAVGISGDTIVVGAPRDDTAAGADAGSAHVFRRTAGTWSHEAQLFAADAQADDRFGHSVAISGETILVGAINEDGGVSNSGAGYVFVRDGSVWSQQEKLSAAMPEGTNPQLGHAASLDGDVAVLGAWQDAPAGQFSVGAAHVFRRAGTTWTEEQKLTASDAANFRWFGQAVAVSGDTVAVGAFGDQAGGLSESGGVYFFEFDGASWNETDNVHASDAAADDRFGWSVDLDGAHAVIGTGISAEKAYLFEDAGGGAWTEASAVTTTVPGLTTEFGYAVAVDGDDILVGDRSGGASGQGIAVAFIFGLECSCPWDLDGCGSVGVTDLLALLAAWGPNPGHPADFDGDDVVGTTDFLALLANWGPCP